MRLSCGLYKSRNTPKRGTVYSIPLFLYVDINIIGCLRGPHNKTRLIRSI